MRVATYNLNYANQSGDAVLNAIAEADADILCLQETTPKSERFLSEKLAGRGTGARHLTKVLDKGEDLYYRLCADMIHTPTLREQIADRPDDLQYLAEFIARRVLTDLPEESHALAREAVDWIGDQLGPDYRWPGNIRELEQCVRNVMIRKSYKPARQSHVADGATAHERLAHKVAEGHFSPEELIEHYVSMIYAAEGQQYGRASKRLDMDWRTLNQKLNQKLIEAYSVR